MPMPTRRAVDTMRARCLRVISFAAALFVCTSSEAAPFWRTPWTFEAPPHASLLPEGTTRGLEGIAFADDGDILLGTQGFYGDQDAFISRIAPDGTLRWNGVVHAYDPPAAVVPLADGGAYATFNTPYLGGGSAARLDANGNTLWARVDNFAFAPFAQALFASGFDD
jgi:outer membrane protein assembly factor BamB